MFISAMLLPHGAKEVLQRVLLQVASQGTFEARIMGKVFPQYEERLNCNKPATSGVGLPGVVKPPVFDRSNYPLEKFQMFRIGTHGVAVVLGVCDYY